MLTMKTCDGDKLCNEIIRIMTPETIKMKNAVKFSHYLLILICCSHLKLAFKFEIEKMRIIEGQTQFRSVPHKVFCTKAKKSYGLTIT